MALPGVVVKITGQATDAVKEIGKVGSALEKLPKSASKAATGISTHTKDLSAKIRKTGDDADVTGKKTGKAFDAMGDSATGAAAGIGEAFGSSGSVAGALGGLGEVVESFAGMFGPMGLAVAAGAGVALGALTKLFTKSSEDAAKAKEAANTYFEAMVDGLGSVDQATKESQWRDYVKERSKDIALFKKMGGSLGDLTRAVQGNGQAAAAVSAQIDQMQEANERAWKEGEIVNQTYTKNRHALDDLKETVNDSAQAYRDGADQLSLYNQGLNETGQSIEELDGKTANTKVNTTYKMHVDDAEIRAFADKYDLSARATNAMVAAASYYKNVPTRMAGGQVMGGEPYLVGESGPETFVPNTSGYVLPTGQGGGSGPVTVNLNLHAAVVTPSVVREAAPIITRAITVAHRNSGSRIPAKVYTSMGV